MRQPSLLVAFGILVGVGVAIACGDPYDGEIPKTEAPVRDAATAEDAPSDGGVDTTPDAADATADVDPCSDRDKDGFLANGCDGGTDCDDDDNRAFPDAGFVGDEPTLVTKGDWNCDDKFTREYPINFKCSDYSGGDLGGTCDLRGFKGDPGCGKTGEFVKCKAPAIAGTCLEESVMQAVQRCK